MIPSTAIPAAQPRKRRTRTTNVSSKLALLLSELPLNSVELTPRAEHMACPACQTWCPLTTHKGSKQWKLVPHHTAKAGTPGARRCGNSNRLVTIDMPIAVWQEQRAEAVADVAARSADHRAEEGSGPAAGRAAPARPRPGHRRLGPHGVRAAPGPLRGMHRNRDLPDWPSPGGRRPGPAVPGAAARRGAGPH